MNSKSLQVPPDSSPGSRTLQVSVSLWVNEPLPNVQELLTSHDVARLIRRPRWLLRGLSLIGRFPAQQRFRGRAIGWRRQEVLGWLTDGLEAANDPAFSAADSMASDPRQHPLPLQIGHQGRSSSKAANASAAPRAAEKRTRNRPPQPLERT
jgi:hypothetical protein